MNSFQDLYEKKYIYNKPKTKLIKYLHMFIALLLLTWLNNGLFTYFTLNIPFYLKISTYIFWFTVVIIENKNFFKVFVFQTKYLLFFILYLLIVMFFKKTTLLTHYIQSMGYLIIIYSLFLNYYNFNYIKFQKVICLFLMSDIIIVGTRTYLMLQRDPLLARYLSTATDSEGIVSRISSYPAVGSYGYFYSLVAIILLLTFMFLNRPQKKVYVFIALVVSILLLIRGTFTISILLAFIFMVLLIIIKYTNKYSKIIYICAFFLFIMLFECFGASLIGWIANMDGLPEVVSVRFQELSDFLSGNSNSSLDLNLRLKFYIQSIQMFYDNIIWGNIMNNNGLSSVGAHSAWLDLLASFGFVSLLFFMFLYDSYIYLKKRIIKDYLVFLKIYWLYFFCLGLINTLLFPNIFIAWFLLLPMFLNKKYYKCRML